MEKDIIGIDAASELGKIGLYYIPFVRLQMKDRVCLDIDVTFCGSDLFGVI